MNRKLKRTYGFDEVALAPAENSINPEEVDISWEFGGGRFDLPILASAMDSVVNEEIAIKMGKMGGLAVLNLDGVQGRYDDPGKVMLELARADAAGFVKTFQKMYREETKEELVSKRIRSIKESGVVVAAATVPKRAEWLGPIAKKAGCDIFVIQSTLATPTHSSSAYEAFDYGKFKKEIGLPVIVGDCATYEGVLGLMEKGVDGILVGVGPGAACTTRMVVGVGVPQISATMDCARARDDYFEKTGRYVSIITDGGMRTSSDICKAFAGGADAVMLGAPFARAEEAPGGGYHWGMATMDQKLPRGTRVKVGTIGPLQEILFGPSKCDDGTENFIGALRTCMGMCNARTIKEMQKAELVIAPSILTEGKLLQRTQAVGMWR